MIVDSQGFFIKINGDGITKPVLEKVMFCLEIICNVPILILQFPKPHQILMMPVELTKNTIFDDSRQLKIRMELTGETAGYTEMLLSENDSNKIRQCRTNLPKSFDFRQAEPIDDYSFSEFAE